MTKPSEMTNEELLNKFIGSWSISITDAGKVPPLETRQRANAVHKEMHTELLRRLAASQPGEPPKAKCPKCGSTELTLYTHEGEVYVHCSDVQTHGAIPLETGNDFLQFFRPSAPTLPQENAIRGLSATVTELRAQLRDACEERDTARQKLIERVAPSGSAGPELAQRAQELLNKAKQYVAGYGVGSDSIKLANAHYIIRELTGTIPEPSAEAKGPELEYAIPEGFVPNDEPDEEHMATMHPCSCDKVDCPECGPRIALRVTTAEPAVVSVSPFKHNHSAGTDYCPACTAAQPVAADLPKDRYNELQQQGCLVECYWNTLDSPNQWVEHADGCPNKTKLGLADLPKRVNLLDEEQSIRPTSKGFSNGADMQKVDEVRKTFAQRLTNLAICNHMRLPQQNDAAYTRLLEEYETVLRSFFPVSQPPTEIGRLYCDLQSAISHLLGLIEAKGLEGWQIGFAKQVVRNVEVQYFGFPLEPTVAPVSGNGKELPPDELYGDVCKYAESNKTVTPSLLQRNFRIGYARAMLLIEQMEANQLIARIEKEKFNSFKWEWAGAPSHNGQGWEEMNKAGWMLYHSLLSMRCCAELKEEPDADECKSMGVAMKAWEAATGEKFQEKFALPAPPSEANGPQEGCELCAAKIPHEWQFCRPVRGHGSTEEK